MAKLQVVQQLWDVQTESVNFHLNELVGQTQDLSHKADDPAYPVDRRIQVDKQNVVGHQEKPNVQT